jgi:hypothetical protein
MVSEKRGLDKEAIEANQKLVQLGKAEAVNYFRLGVFVREAQRCGSRH